MGASWVIQSFLRVLPSNENHTTPALSPCQGYFSISFVYERVQKQVVNDHVQSYSRAHEKILKSGSTMLGSVLDLGHGLARPRKHVNTRDLIAGKVSRVRDGGSSA